MSDHEQADDSNQKMYQELKRLWMSSQSQQSLDPAELEEADLEFEQFIDRLVQMEPQRLESPPAEQHQHDTPAITQGQFMMEVILELDQTVALVPPRVRDYRNLLAAAQLNRAASDDLDGDDPGQKGMAGINLADQAALEFHSNLLGLAFNIAKDAAMEKILARKDDSSTWPFTESGPQSS